MKRIKQGMMLIAGLLALAVFVTACGPGASPTPTGTGSPTPSATSMPQVAVVALLSIPVTDWDPAVEFSNGVMILHNVYETLLCYEPLEDTFTPLLATDYTHSDDGLTWTFHIRQGVKFHDGTELDSNAVKFSIERTIKIGKGATFIWDPVDKIETPDKFTVVFKLKYPAPMDLIVSSAYAAFIVSPAAAQNNPDDWFTQGNECGTGPYKLESQKMGEEVILTKFGDYWKGWQGKHFDKIYYKKVSEDTSRRQMLEKGDADWTMELTSEDIEALKTNPNVTIEVNPSFENLLGFFNTEKAPLNNKLVRQALSYAFPYEDVVKYAMGGYAEQAKGPVPKGLWGHGGNLFQYSYNLDKAKELLTQAGYPNGGLKFLATYNSGDETEKKVCELYKSELAKLNIELEIRGMPWESQWELAKATNPNDRQDIFFMYWWPDVTTPYTYLFNLYHSQPETVFNFNYINDPELDKLIDDANTQAGIDRTTAAQMFIDAQKKIIDEAYGLFAYDKKYVRPFNKSLKGYKDNPSYPHVIFFYDCYRE
jgi:peptide/nickel transport system substrate-binding protein